MSKIPKSQIEKANEFPIMDILEHFGFQPCANRGKEYIFFSPFRIEKTPSFSVNIALNKAKDFGDDEYSGDAIRIYRALSGKNFMSAVNDLYNKRGFDAQMNYMPLVANKEEKKHAEIVLVKDKVENKNLLYYAQSRGISEETLNMYCVEVHYKQPSGKIFYSIGFKNLSGGYELRSANFKSCVGTKDISLIKGKNNESVIVFEGFFNMLSYMEYLKLKGGGFNEMVSIAVLNTSNLWRKLPHYKAVYCVLDKDTTGKKTFEKIKENYSESTVFDHGKNIGYTTDLNDFLVESLQK